MHTRKLLVLVSLILSVAGSTNPSLAARGGGGGGGGHGVSVHSSGGGQRMGGGSSRGGSRGFFHGGRGYGYGGYGNGYDQANSGGMWGEGPTWGNGGSPQYAAAYGGPSTAGYSTPSYAPEQLVKNYSWPDSTNRRVVSAPSQQPALPAGKAAKAGTLDDLIRDTSKY